MNENDVVSKNMKATKGEPQVETWVVVDKKK